MISINSSEAKARSNGIFSRSTASTGVVECDWCGRTVQREAAYERVQRADDEVETAYLCASCELGGD
jgi:ribosomal protein S26